VIGDHGIDGAARISTQEDWARTLLRALPGAVSGDVAGADEIAADAGAKSALAQKTGAAAVDMESHIAARVAARWNKPFAIARAISDGAGRSLPPAALIAMRSGGAIDVKAVLRSLLANPGQAPALARTAFEAEAGFRALLRGREILGAGLGFGVVDLGHLPLDVT
jgi:hypothetical protein